MDERQLDLLVDAVLRRLPNDAPTALLIGSPPPETLGYHVTDCAPYEAVLIGSLSAEALLNFREMAVFDALLTGRPVYLWEGGLGYRKYAATANRALWSRLLAAERNLQQWGVRFYGGGHGGRLITADQARQLQAQGRKPPAGAILSPMARDILGGSRS